MPTNINLNGINELDVSVTGGTSSASVSGSVASLTITPSAGGVGGVNAQTGTTYTLVNGDRGLLVTFNNASPVAVTIPQAGSGGNFNGTWFAFIENLGAGAVTLTPTTSTIDGAGSLVLNQNQGIILFSDNTNYSTERGAGTGGGGGVTSVGLTMPGEFSVSGSPVTTTGTLAVTKANQTANQVYAGPTTGSPAAPAFRALVDADIPAGIVRNTRQIINGTGIAGGGDLSADRTLSVVANTTNQQVKIDKAGSLIGTRKEVNFIEGSNVTLTVADNGGSDRVDVTIAAAVSSAISGSAACQSRQANGSASVNWNNQTSRCKLPYFMVINAMPSFKMRLVFDAGTGCHIQKAVVKRTARNSTTVIDTTNITFNGGSTAYNFSFGATATTAVPIFLDSDTCALAIDAAHDFYFYVFTDNDAAGSNFNTSVGFPNDSNVTTGGNTALALQSVFSAGDITGEATISAGSATNATCIHRIFAP